MVNKPIEGKNVTVIRSNGFAGEDLKSIYRLSCRIPFGVNVAEERAMGRRDFMGWMYSCLIFILATVIAIVERITEWYAIYCE